MKKEQLKRLLANIADKLRRFARNLAPFGYRQEAFHGGRQLLFIWQFGFTRWEVWDHGPNMSSNDVDCWLGRVAQSERYSRITLSAKRLYRGKDWRIAKDMV